MSFKNKYTIQQRLQESTRIINNHPNRIPIICEKSSAASLYCPIINKNKFLVPPELTVSQFLIVIRNRMKLKPEMALFLFINETIPPGTALMSEMYELYRDKDDFLYISYTTENTFG